MLSFQTVHSDTLELLKRLMHLPILDDMRLVGGTALALQYGHRRSVDLDFFGETTEDVHELTDALTDITKEIQIVNYTKRIKTYMLDDVKVDFVNYQYRWLQEPIVYDGIRLAAPKDIAAMKVNAVMGRGTKKDFIDIYYLLKHYSFEEILHFYLEKYPEGSTYRALLSMTYFEDADMQPSPYMLEDLEWEEIKRKIESEVCRYNNKIIE